ncbi:probable inactive poly [ADP-ribose] polymerase SRO2 isoform X2 [Phalaenopsis equestris]|uniref:probable inactive poly [ADP-ribose] polymerase SRO2 isoform X2 n=1 Tax=Phalaenopsis equestris TaxID=78828 RepID=UPI0009E35B88|nr:probable inactive poly [ADP-ribose] polymerase SRO2 isoform X2 [Phalaenopsis equestris]
MNGSIVDDDPIEFNYEASDSESITTESTELRAFEDGALLHLDEGDDEHINLKHNFLISIGRLAECCSVVEIRRVMHYFSAMGRAQLGAFGLYVRALAEKNGGNANLNMGWYGTSVEGVRKIVRNGFGSDGVPMGGTFGFGICIYGASSAANWHLIFCRVILGKTEEFLPGTKPFGLISDEFDSGVDNQKFPRRYIVRFSDAKTRVLPLYVLTVQLENTQSKGSLKEIVGRPHSPWISFSKLIYTLSKCLSSSKICLIKRFHVKYMERRISRIQLVTQLRQTVGDELLVSVIRKFHERNRENKIHSLQRH